ncbi:MAG TPA: hypothetical protein VLX59_04235 [Acidimicrobiales bacterium]|nr:hypothetical protein [Acidimicrobiales bacterium]
MDQLPGGGTGSPGPGGDPDGRDVGGRVVDVVDDESAATDGTQPFGGSGRLRTPPLPLPLMPGGEFFATPSFSQRP